MAFGSERLLLLVILNVLTANFQDFMFGNFTFLHMGITSKFGDGGCWVMGRH